MGMYRYVATIEQRIIFTILAGLQRKHNSLVRSMCLMKSFYCPASFKKRAFSR